MTSRKLSAEVGTRVARALGRMAGDGFSVELPYMNDAGVYWFCCASLSADDLACLTVTVRDGRTYAQPETSRGTLGIQASGSAAKMVTLILEGK